MNDQSTSDPRIAERLARQAAREASIAGHTQEAEPEIVWWVDPETGERLPMERPATTQRAIRTPEERAAHLARCEEAIAASLARRELQLQILRTPDGAEWPCLSIAPASAPLVPIFTSDRSHGPAAARQRRLRRHTSKASSGSDGDGGDGAGDPDEVARLDRFATNRLASELLAELRAAGARSASRFYRETGRWAS